MTVTLSKPPMRIVSLLPSLTETICALGKCASLVGVDRYSNFPKAVQSLPRVGGGIDPNVEAIVALRPDLVIMATSAQGAGRLESLGIKVAALEPKTHADVQRVLNQVGQLLGVGDTQQVWRAMDNEVTAAAQTVPAAVRGSRVYFEVSSAPHAAGESSFIGETLSRLGCAQHCCSQAGAVSQTQPGVRGACRSGCDHGGATFRMCVWSSVRVGAPCARCVTSACAFSRQSSPTCWCAPGRAWPKVRA